MPILSFRVDPRYLVYHTLTRCEAGAFVAAATDLIAFQNKAWEVDERAYQFLMNGPDGDHVMEHKILEIAQRAENLIQQMQKEPLFEKILNETEESSILVAAEWQQDYERSTAIMRSLTGVDADDDFEILLTHPHQRNGGNAGKQILWAYRNTWPHYNTVYLWHEILHFYLPTHDTAHAIIELVTDNELRVRLNGEGQYPPFEGHPELNQFRERMMDDWWQYLKSDTKDILKFITDHEVVDTNSDEMDLPSLMNTL